MITQTRQSISVQCLKKSLVIWDQLWQTLDFFWKKNEKIKFVKALFSSPKEGGEPNIIFVSRPVSMKKQVDRPLRTNIFSSSFFPTIGPNRRNLPLHPYYSSGFAARTHLIHVTNQLLSGCIYYLRKCKSTRGREWRAEMEIKLSGIFHEDLVTCKCANDKSP